MSAALFIDITLWGSVAVLAFMVWRRGRVVALASAREGAMDFINIVPRVALGVIGSGYIAAVIPPEVITGWLGPDSGFRMPAMPRKSVDLPAPLGPITASSAPEATWPER